MAKRESDPVTTQAPTPDGSVELVRLAQSVESVTQRDLFIWVGAFGETSENSYSSLADHLEEECEARFGRATSDASLDVLLHSPGGSADAAYHAVLVLRQFASSIRVLVPSWAKSAATLFALGGDTIVMSSRAQLGPLDAQLVDPRNTALGMSALDGYMSVGFIREFALEAQHQAVAEMIDRTEGEVPVPELIQRGREFAQCLISPVMAQVRPLDYGSWARALAVAEKYAATLLSRFGETEGDAESLAHELVHGYPHHGYVIDILEAQRLLGRRVERMSTELVVATRAVEQVLGAGGAAPSPFEFIGFVPRLESNEPAQGTSRQGGSSRRRTRAR